MNLTIITYLAIVGATLAIVFFLLRFFGKNAFTFALAESIYGAVAGYAALKVAHDFFMVLQLLAIGAFIGGWFFLAFVITLRVPNLDSSRSPTRFLLGATVLSGSGRVSH